MRDWADRSRSAALYRLRIARIRCTILLPEGWAPPIGYANGIAVDAGRIVFIAGQVGWDAQQRFHSDDIAPQFDQALQNVVAVLAQAGGRPRAHLPDDRLLLRQARVPRGAARAGRDLAPAHGRRTTRR